MKIKMLETDMGSINGIHVSQYAEGVEYEIPDDLAKQFIIKGSAAEVEPPKEQEEIPDPEDTPAPPTSKGRGKRK
jgi:hypothetical protein